MDSRVERFRAVFDAAYAPLVAYFRRRVPHGDVDDLVAEVLTIAWQRLDDVPAGDGALPWLYGTARRVLGNRRRADARRGRLVDRLRRERRPTTVTQDARDDAPVVRALRSLPSRDQEILALAAWEGLTPAELAITLECSANAAALRLSRARRKLRDAMTGSGPVRTGAGVEERHG